MGIHAIELNHGFGHIDAPAYALAFVVLFYYYLFLELPFFIIIFFSRGARKRNLSQSQLSGIAVVRGRDVADGPVPVSELHGSSLNRQPLLGRIHHQRMGPAAVLIVQ